MSVTEQDRERAVALLRAASADDLIHPTAPMTQPLMVNRIAKALADERERARAPFLALAEEFRQRQSVYAHAATGSYDNGLSNAYGIAYDRISRAAEGTL